MGAFLERLRQEGLYDRSIVILLSDHGEGLMEHGERHHGVLLYRWALHVPLLLKLPGGARAGTVVRTPVQLVDVVPTLTRLLKLPPGEGLPGRSLLDEGGPSRRIYAETWYPRIHLGWSELRSLVDERHQLIEGPRPELYDIGEDPRQVRDLAAAEAGTLRSLQAEMVRRHPSGFSAPEPVDAEVRERLAALGYLGGASPATAERPVPNPRDRIQEIEEVEAAFRLGKRQDGEAVAAFRRLLGKNPRQLDVQLGLAEALVRLERYEEAAASYRAALAIAPAMSGEIGLALARVSLLLERLDDVETHARAGLETSPAQAHELLAWAALGRADLGRAEREAGRALALAPAATGSALALAEVHIQRSELREALTVLEGASARLRSTSGGPVRGFELARGDVLARLGRYPEAQAAFRSEIASFPRNSEAYARLAIVLAVEGRRKSEVASLLEAMHAANPQPETALLAAKTLESIGDTPRAAEWRRRAARQRPRTAAAI